MSASGPFATVLTASARGAVAVIRVFGPGAVEAADSVFRPPGGRSLLETPPGRLRVGRVGPGPGDEVVAVLLEDAQVEFQGHAGPFAVQLVLNALESAGVQTVPPSRWLSQTARSRIQSEALEDLAKTETLRASEILLEQSEGALDAELASVSESLEVRALDALLSRAEVGQRLVSGWTVALTGRPNVGKSRLLNALAGFDRAIVDPTPGTTRDLVSIRTALDGWPVDLLDSAGLRESLDPLESAGISLARSALSDADLVVLVLDLSEPLTDPDLSLIEAFPNALLVANKSDLPPLWPAASLDALPISAERGDGLDSLVRDLSAHLVPNPPPPGSGVPFRSSHARILTRARQRLTEGRASKAARLLERLMR